MRTLALVLLALAACSKPPPAKKPPAKKTTPAVKWGTVRIYDFDVQLPVTWSKAKAFPGSHMVFGPWDDGFQPNLQIYWDTAKYKNAEQVYDHFRKKMETPGGGRKIRGDGTDTVAGVPARYLVYTQTRVDREAGQEIMYTTIDWYFVRGDKRGILRCISTSRMFGLKYRPLYEEIKSRLRFAKR